MTPTDLQALLDENFAPWVKALEMTVSDAGPDGAVLTMPMGDHLLRTGGIVSGQALAALADTAMVLAAISARDAFVPFATTNLDTQFLRPGTGSVITCDARIVRAGRAVTFAAATMTDDQDRAVATATATLFAA